MDEDEILSDGERIERSSESVESKVYAAKKLSRFFELDITLRVFGQVVFHWVFPPKN